MELTCPKCHAAMRTYERNDVHVDQCTECRGIFLDRGELERLVAAENAWHAAGSAPGGARTRYDEPQQPPARVGDLGAVVGEVLHQARGSKHQSSGHHYGGHDYRKKKKSFLEELFD